MGSGRNLADPDATVGEQEGTRAFLLMRILDRTERDSIVTRFGVGVVFRTAAGGLRGHSRTLAHDGVLALLSPKSSKARV
jgi:hypothetical protein